MINITQNITDIRHQICLEAEKNFRNPQDIKLLAVSKTCSTEQIKLAFQAGQYCFGENYLQEALQKIEQLGDLLVEWHFIGPIQSASRVFITKSIDENSQASGFGLFALSGKLTSFIGPYTVSTLTYISNSQRIGFSAAIILLVIGLLVLLKVKKN